MSQSGNWFDKPLGDPPRGTTEAYDKQRMVATNLADQATANRKAEEIRRQSLRPGEPPGPDDGASGRQPPRAKRSGPPRGLASRWLYLSIPLGIVALTLSVDSSGDRVLFPSWQRLIFAVLIVALGSPRLRTVAFTLLILAFAMAWILGG